MLISRDIPSSLLASSTQPLIVLSPSDTPTYDIHDNVTVLWQAPMATGAPTMNCDQNMEGLSMGPFSSKLNKSVVVANEDNRHLTDPPVSG